MINYMRIGIKVFLASWMLLMSLSVAIGQTTKIKVACVGDSVTYGTGIEDRDNNSYPAQLQKMLGETYLVGNFGKPGATLLSKGHRPYFKQEQFTDAMNFHGDIAIVHLGLNDTDPRNWPNYRDEFHRDYSALLDSLRKSNPKVRIIMALTSPITHAHKRFASSTRVWHEQIQEELKRISEVEGIELIDFHTPLYNRPDLLPDSIHPNAEGAGLIAQAVYSAVTGNYGGLKMPVTYGNGMVLQRERPILISGSANVGDEVTVKLGKDKAKTIVPISGKWEVSLKPLKATTGLTLTISTRETELVYIDVAIGDVWLCSGQSNMAFMVKEMKDSTVLIGCDDKNLRFFDMKAKWNTNNRKWSDAAIESVQKLQYYDVKGWQECSEASAHRFSAVGYFFGKMLRDSLDVPVGLICNAIGGSTTESWIDRHTLESAIPAIYKDWLNNDYTQDWARKRAAKNIGAPQSGATRHPYEPSYLFESGVLQLERFPIKGVIWYQGESNAHNVELHESLFQLLIKSWRSYWRQQELPFYFVQLSSINRPSWPHFRDSQRRLAETIPFTGMAVSSDVGDSLDVHPKNKRPVGERLAKVALHDTYGYAIECSGPTLRSMDVKGKKVILEFDHAEGLTTSDGKDVIGFEVAGYDKVYHEAIAEIKNDKVLLKFNADITPQYVRYAWKPFTRANLINGSGLPASTFEFKL